MVYECAESTRAALGAGLEAAGECGRGVASDEPRQARAGAASAAGAEGLYDGIHHGLRLLERCVRTVHISLTKT